MTGIIRSYHDPELNLNVEVIEQRTLSIDEIRYSSQYASTHWSDGKTLAQVIIELLAETRPWSDIHPLRIVQRSDGLFFTHENQKLAMLQTMLLYGKISSDI